MHRHLALALFLALPLAACERVPTAPITTPLDPGGPPPPRRAASASPDAGPPAPYNFGPDTYRTGLFTGQGTTEPGLDCEASTADYRQCDGFLASDVDGTLLDVRVQVPHGGGPFPLVVLLHGWGGSKGGSSDIAERLLAQGHGVLRYSARGFGDSWGQINLADRHVEIGDLRSMIAQVVDRRGLRLDPDAVALTGASYGGGQSWLAAAAPAFRSPSGTPIRIRTIVPLVAWTDLLYSLAPNGVVRHSVEPIGGAKLSYVNALYVAGWRDDPRRPYPSYADYIVAWHAWINSAEPLAADPVWRTIADGLAGYRSIWWQYDFWRTAPVVRLPILSLQGFTDDLFGPAETTRMLRALRSLDPGYPIAAYFGDVGHPRAANKPAEVEYALALAERWLGYYLKNEGTEPAHVVHAAITRPRAEPFDPANVITVPEWDALATRRIETAFEGSAVLVNPASDPTTGFFWDPLVMEGARELRWFPEPPPESPVSEASLATYTIPVAELSGGAPLLIAGEPAVRLRLETAAPRVQLNVRLFEVRADGSRELITRGTLTLESTLPLGVRDVTIAANANLWRAEPSSTLRLEITNLDAPYIAPSRVPSVSTISNVRLDLPVRE